MREGRLQSQTLANIWKSLDQHEDFMVRGTSEIAIKLQKSYIPTQGDSPLYRLVSTSSAESSIAGESQIDVLLPQSEPIPDEYSLPNIINFATTPRGQSVPNVHANQHLPTPRIVQSTGNLFQHSLVDQHIVPRRHIRPERTHSFMQALLNTERNPQKPKDWTDEYCHIDIDWSMQAMDVLYSASFYDYIRDEKNVELSAMRLSRIIKDYKPRQVANALTWMTQGWSIENSSTLLKVVFADWLPDLAGCVFALISKSWPKIPQCSLCTAYVLVGEPAQTVSLFIKSLTHYWTKKEAIDLITYLDSVLKWSVDYLQEVIFIFASSTSQDSSNNDLERNNPKNHVSDLFDAAKNLMEAKNELALAEYQLLLFSHWSKCSRCQNKEECEELKKCRNTELDLKFDIGESPA